MTLAHRRRARRVRLHKVKSVAKTRRRRSSSAEAMTNALRTVLAGRSGELRSSDVRLNERGYDSLVSTFQHVPNGD